MQKIIKVSYTGYPDAQGFDKLQYWYWCLGCGYIHAFATHTFNQDMINPTVSPSLLHSNPQQHHTCHSYIQNGMIQYLGDCWHNLKGTTIELPDVIEEMKKMNYNYSGELVMQPNGLYEIVVDWSK